MPVRALPPPLAVHRPPWRTRIRIALWRIRVPFAALLLGLAAAVAVDELRPSPPATVDVLVAARDLAVGTALTAADVRVAAFPPHAAPTAARVTDPASLVGRRTAVPVPAGLPLVPGVLAGGHLTGPPGTVVAAVRLADPAVVRLLSPGDRVDLLAASAAGGPATTVADGAVVLPSPADGAAAGGLLGSTGSAADQVPLMVAVRPEEAAAVAGAVGGSELSAVVVP